MNILTIKKLFHIKLYYIWIKKIEYMKYIFSELKIVNKHLNNTTENRKKNHKLITSFYHLMVISQIMSKYILAFFFKINHHTISNLCWKIFVTAVFFTTNCLEFENIIIKLLAYREKYFIYWKAYFSFQLYSKNHKQN